MLLYKLQKEQEGALAEKARSGRHSQPPSSSPGAASVSLVSQFIISLCIFMVSKHRLLDWSEMCRSRKKT